MISIKSPSNNPHFNMALDEYAIKHLDLNDDLIILYQNEPSVIIGRNQNTIEEINSKYIKDNNIHVARRLSGGGAVYHDLGNLNFTFVTKNTEDSLSNFRKFTLPVIQVLNKLGVNAEFTGRNDITIEGKKFSGNAQYYYREKMFHHGTILFNSDLSIVQEALNVKLDKIQSKGIKSVRSRVTNVYPYLENKITAEEFKDFLLTSILEEHNSIGNEYILSDEDIKNLDKLVKEKFSTWEWNYGESPDFDIVKFKRYQGGKVDLRLNVKNGIIEEVKVFGDFFGSKDISELENLLISKKYEENTVREILKDLDFNSYMFNISVDDFIDCMFY